jgi:hypothetical protein
MKLSPTKAIKACFWFANPGNPVLRSFVFFVLITLIATLGLMAGADAAKSPGDRAQSSSAMPTQSYEGMITDTRCGAKHSTAIGLAAADCTRVCIHAGEEFALVDGDKVYVLSGDRDALKPVAGQRVRVLGTLNGNTISVSSVTPGK